MFVRSGVSGVLHNAGGEQVLFKTCVRCCAMRKKNYLSFFSLGWLKCKWLLVCIKAVKASPIPQIGVVPGSKNNNTTAVNLEK